MFVIELEPGVWYCSWWLTRTLLIKHASQYKTRHGAKVALGILRKRTGMPWLNAQIEEI